MNTSSEHIFLHNLKVLKTFGIIKGYDNNMDINIKLLVSYVKLMILNEKINKSIENPKSLTDDNDDIIMDMINKKLNSKDFFSVITTKELYPMMKKFTLIPLDKQGISLSKIIIYKGIPYLDISDKEKNIKHIKKYVYRIRERLLLNINELFTEKMLAYVEK